MRKLLVIALALVTALLTSTTLALAAPTAAEAQPDTPVLLGTFYLCDGSGQGSCASLTPGSGEPTGPADILAVGMSQGPWRWDIWATTPVTVSPDSPFSYAPIDNALQGQDILTFKLHAYPSWCMGNSGGSDILKPCDLSNSEEWVFDPNSGYVVNVGRSNDQNNWEVLCNPGGGAGLVIGTRDSCSTYHREWSWF